MYRLPLFTALSCLFSVLLTSTTTPLSVPVYQEVVTVAERSIAQLRNVTVQYLQAVDKEKPKKQRGQWQANPDSTQFTFCGDFLLYNRKTVKHPLGEITYRTTIDLKEGKYRYTADSVFFQAYQRNRYSRYVPSRQPAVAWPQAQVGFSEKEQQRVLAGLTNRFQAFKNFMHAQSQPNESLSKVKW